MLFKFYLGTMVIAVLLSMFNMRRGDIRLTSLAISYFLVISLFHLIFMTWLGLGWRNQEFYLLVAGAQSIVAYVAHQTGCRAARIIMPLALIAVVGNVETFLFNADYPHALYFDFMNFIQCTQIASLWFASAMFYPITTRLWIGQRSKTDSLKRVAHGNAG